MSFFDVDRLRIPGRMQILITALLNRVLTLPDYRNGPELLKYPRIIDLQNENNMLVATQCVPFGIWVPMSYTSLWEHK